MNFLKERALVKCKYQDEWNDFMEKNPHLFSEHIWKGHGGICKMIIRQLEAKQDILKKLSEKHPDIIKTKEIIKKDIIGDYKDLEYYILGFAGKFREILLVVRN